MSKLVPKNQCGPICIRAPKITRQNHVKRCYCSKRRSRFSVIKSRQYSPSFPYHAIRSLQLAEKLQYLYTIYRQFMAITVFFLIFFNCVNKLTVVFHKSLRPMGSFRCLTYPADNEDIPDSSCFAWKAWAIVPLLGVRWFVKASHANALAHGAARSRCIRYRHSEVLATAVQQNCRTRNESLLRQKRQRHGTTWYSAA